MEMELNQLLETLYSSTITKFKIDLAHHEIYFKLNADHFDRPCKLKFHDVASFYFISREGDDRFNLPVWYYAELTSITYQKSGNEIKVVNTTKSETQYFSKANFTMEIWSTFFFIEAQGVTINDHTFAF